MVTMNNYYNIQSITSSTFLVTILSCEMSEVYWESLINDIKTVNNNTIVYVDFLFRNGFNDRYYVLQSNDDGKITVIPCKIELSVERVADLFFMKYPLFIERSSLSTFQKKFYYNRLKRLFNQV